MVTKRYMTVYMYIQAYTAAGWLHHRSAAMARQAAAKQASRRISVKTFPPLDPPPQLSLSWPPVFDECAHVGSKSETSYKLSKYQKSY